MIEKTTSVDAALFGSIPEAIDFVAQRGGGVVRVQTNISPTTEYWKGLSAQAEKVGVRLEQQNPAPGESPCYYDVYSGVC